MRGLEPTLKSARLANYLMTLRKETEWIARGCGYHHPAQLRLSDFELIDEAFTSRPMSEVFGLDPSWKTDLSSAAYDAMIEGRPKPGPGLSAVWPV